jgi:hypothetical protein
VYSTLPSRQCFGTESAFDGRLDPDRIPNGDLDPGGLKRVKMKAKTHSKDQDCGSGFIQSGSTKFLIPDPMRIRIHKVKFEDKFFSKF